MTPCPNGCGVLSPLPSADPLVLKFECNRCGMKQTQEKGRERFTPPPAFVYPSWQRAHKWPKRDE